MKTEYDTLDESRRADFEEQVVCKILRAGGVIARVRQFKEEQRTLSGSPQLTLAWLRGRFPSFTLRLRAVLLDDDELILADLFERFTSTAFFKAYRHWCNSDRIDDHKEAVGLVFNIDGVTFVLHNCQAALKQPVRRVIRSIGSPPVTFAFEELSSLLDSIDDDWTAEYATAENIGDTSDDD